MKLIKKIGIGCLVLIICFCSCFKFVNAQQIDFIYDDDGPTLQTYYSSINFAYSAVDNSTSVYNSSFSLQSSFYEPHTLDFTYGTETNTYFSITNEFNYDQLLQSYMLSQKIQSRLSSLATFSITYNDLFVYKLDDLSIPNFSIDIGYINIEQSFSLTYEYSYFNTTTKSIEFASETQPIQLTTEDNKTFYFDVRSTLVDLLSSDMLNTDSTHGGLGYISSISFNIIPLDALNSNYITTFEFTPIQLTSYGNVFAQNEFFIAISETRASGILGWLLESIDVFMSTELFPNFSIGTLLGVIVAIPILIYVLRLFMGG